MLEYFLTIHILVTDPDHTRVRSIVVYDPYDVRLAPSK